MKTVKCVDLFQYVHSGGGQEAPSLLSSSRFGETTRYAGIDANFSSKDPLSSVSLRLGEASSDRGELGGAGGCWGL